MLLAGFAVILAMQPLDTVRHGWVLHAATAALTVATGAVVSMPMLPTLVFGVAAACLGIAAFAGARLSSFTVPPLGVAVAVLAGLAAERPLAAREAALSAFGGALGLATASLLLWSLFDALRRCLGNIACKVAGSWVAAIGIMTAALPR